MCTIDFVVYFRWILKCFYCLYSLLPIYKKILSIVQNFYILKTDIDVLESGLI